LRFRLSGDFRRPGARCARLTIVLEGKNLHLERFDAITKELVAVTDRRGMVRKLTGVALGGILVATRVSEAAGAKPKSASLYLDQDHLTGCDGADLDLPTRGSVAFRLDKNGSIVANISLQNAEFNADYDVFQRCVNFLGTIHTNGKGQAKGSFTYSPSSSNGLDMYGPTEYVGMGPYPA
jgi:hypothetical protein